MDLKALRDQAISEANDEFHTENVNTFKANIKDIIYRISQNNASIVEYQEKNEKLRKELDVLELKEVDRVEL